MLIAKRSHWSQVGQFINITQYWLRPYCFALKQILNSRRIKNHRPCFLHSHSSLQGTIFKYRLVLMIFKMFLHFIILKANGYTYVFIQSLFYEFQHSERVTILLIKWETRYSYKKEMLPYRCHFRLITKMQYTIIYVQLTHSFGKMTH